MSKRIHLHRTICFTAISLVTWLLFSSTVATAGVVTIPNPAIIAHRGDSYNAPESTLPAYQLACQLGANYLELDLQRTKDGKLVVFHDNTLTRTTNIASVYPTRTKEPLSQFTFAELEKLDAGSWYNTLYPDRARPGFNGLKILTLKQVSDIARLCPHATGLYIETKVPEQFPGIEKDLAAFLRSNHWLDHPDNGKIILQTFSKNSLIELQHEMPKVPKILLLWGGDGDIALKLAAPKHKNESDADYYARLHVANQEAYAKWLDFAKQHGAIGVGPATVQSNHTGKFSSQFSYMELAAPWMVNMSHAKGLLVHAYTVDQPIDFERYRDSGVDGFFTNRTEVAENLLHHQRQPNINQMLTRLGY